MALLQNQLQPFFLSGSGVVVGATTITLKSMLTIDGATLTMATDFGDIAYGTIDAGNSTLEEQISFTGLTNNANGTTTLTGVKTVLFDSPYTETSGLAKTHAGSAPFVISNTSGFYASFTKKASDEVITGTWTFNAFPVTPATPLATTLVAGFTEISTQAEVYAKTATGGTGASLTVTPALMPSVLLSDYKADTGSANTYVIAPSPAITAYTTGQTFTFKATAANTGASTLNVNGLGTKTIKTVVGADLTANAIVANQMVQVEYDGTNFQLMSPAGNDVVKFGGTGADGALTITSGTTSLDLGGVSVFVKNYSSVSITGTGSLAFTNPHANGTIVVIKSQGGVTLTSSATPMIDCRSLGAAGGSGASGNGNPGNGSFTWADQTVNGGGGGSSDDGAGGGGSYYNSGIVGSGGSPGAGGVAVATLRSTSQFGQYQKTIKVWAGAGGGEGGETSGTAGAGGRGGGGLYIECGGAWNFTTAGGISVAGAVGSNGVGGNAGGGGGGAGGSVFALYGSLTANSGTITVTGGAGGTAAGTGSAGGDGGAGNSYVAANTEFV